MRNLMDSLRREAVDAPVSGIVEVMTHGRARGNVMPLWAGEGDLATPDFIRDAAARSLADGETFYTWQKGIPELREALARYHTRHFGQSFAAEEFIVTGSGMQAIQLAIQALAGTGDEVVYLSPAWPNLAAAAGIAGARPVAVELVPVDGGWALDGQRLAASITPRTRALFVNSPSNPTGWTASHDELRAILALARTHGLWVIADEIYALFFYAGHRAPSFFDVAEPDDRILFVNSFSKNWAMTGWRVGWLRIPPELGELFENLVQYSTSGVAQFMQRGAVAALDEGDGFIAMQVARARQAAQGLVARLAATNRVSVAMPAGAFYLFFAVDGVTDSRAAAFALVDNAGVGLAPGTAFGPGGERYLRLCFNRDLDQVAEAGERIARWISAL
jgi:aspartate/methionine/tyrosine aminotransferase